MQINLLPNLVLNRRREARIKQLAALGLIVWAAVLGISVIGMLVYQRVQASRLDSAKQKFATLDATVNSSENKKFRQEALEVQGSLNALNSLLGSQQQIAIINEYLAKLTPKTVRLRTTKIGSDGKIDISATAGSYSDASKFILALKQSEEKAGDDDVYFTNVVLSGANQADKGIAFSISTIYVDPRLGAKQ